MPLLTLAEAKASLNITSTEFDVELTDYLMAVDEVVTSFCGPTDAVAATQVVRGCGAIPLTLTPVLSLTSVVGDVWGVIDVATLRVNSSTGVIRRKTPYGIPIREDYYTVVCTLGRTDPPPALRMAARVILKHVWATQRGSGTRRAGTGGDDATLVPGLGYTVPNRALAFMKPYALGPTVA